MVTGLSPLMGQHLRHKAAAEVFKRQGRAVEQLQTTDVRLHLLNRSREGKRRTHALFQQLLRDFVADKRRQNFGAVATKSRFSSSSMSVSGNSGRSRGKNSPDFAQPLSHCLREADLLVAIFQIIEFHPLSQYSCASRVQTANMNKASDFAGSV